MTRKTKIVFWPLLTKERRKGRKYEKLGKDGTRRNKYNSKSCPGEMRWLGWVRLHPYRSYRLGTGPICTGLFRSGQGQIIRPADFWPLAIRRPIILPNSLKSLSNEG